MQMYILSLIFFLYTLIIGTKDFCKATRFFIYVRLLFSPLFAIPRIGNLPIITLSRASFLGLLILFIIRPLLSKNEKNYFADFPLKKTVIIFTSLLAFASIFGINSFHSIFSFFIAFTEGYLLFFIIWRGVKSKEQSYKILHRLFFLFTLICFYGISTYFTKINIYNDIAIKYGTNKSIILANFIERARGSLHGVINSIYYHPVEFAANIIIFIPIFWIFVFEDKKKKIWKILILLLFMIASVLTGSRSLILSIGVFVILQLLKYNLKEKIVILLMVSLIFGITIYYTNNADLMISTFLFWENNSDIKGSSIELRKTQMKGSVDLFQQRMLTGFGYNFTSTIQNTPGYEHMKGFESIIFQVLINNGILGIIAYSILFIGLFKAFNKKPNSTITRAKEIKTFKFGIICYLLFICITGPMLTFSMFIIVYTVALRLFPK